MSGQRCMQTGKIGRQFRSELQDFAARRVRDPQNMGMQGLPAKVGQGFPRARRQKARFGAESSPVGLIADKRMANRGQMHANLVGSAGFQAAIKKACHGFGRLGLARLGPLGLAAFGRFRLAGIALQQLPMSDRLTPTRADRHTVAGPGIAVDRRVDDRAAGN